MIPDNHPEKSNQGGCELQAAASPCGQWKTTQQGAALVAQ